jgi:O-antigen ligase
MGGIVVLAWLRLYTGPGSHAVFGRYVGFTEQFNDFGLSAAIGAPLAVSFLLSGRLRSRAIASALVAMVAIPVVASGSVSSALGAGLGVAIVVGVTPMEAARRGTKALLASVLLVCLAVVLVQAPASNSLLERVRDISAAAQTGESDRSVSPRLTLYQDAATQISDSPIVGRGLDIDSRRFSNEARLDTHNLLLRAWVEGGLFAVTGIVLVIAASVASALRCLRARREIPLAAGAIGCIGALVAAGMFQPILYQRYAWIPVAFGLCLGQSVRTSASPSGTRDRVWSS